MPEEEQDKDVPPVLYKYYPPEHLSVIGTWRGWFSSPRDFNDTFDSYYRTNPAGLEIRTTFHNSLGIFCLSADPDNHLMWVNYAKQHTGFVIGFKTNCEFFTYHNRLLRRVIYGQRSPLIAAPQEPDESACCYKSDDWSYEREWRCIERFTPIESRSVRFGVETVSEIILGWKMQSTDVVNIL